MPKIYNIIFTFLLISNIALIAQIIPISEKNPFASSSFLPSSKITDYDPANLCDFDQSTAWVEGVKGDGVGEWVAIYLGKLEELKDISEVEITIYAGYQKGWESYKNNSVPTKLQLELYVDDKVVSSTILNEPEEDWQLGTRKVNLKPSVRDVNSEMVWLKATILKVQKGKKWDDTAISEIICDCKNANPHNLNISINKFCKAINEKIID